MYYFEHLGASFGFIILLYEVTSKMKTNLEQRYEEYKAKGGELPLVDFDRTTALRLSDLDIASARNTLYGLREYNDPSCVGGVARFRAVWANKGNPSRGERNSRDWMIGQARLLVQA